MIRPSLPLSFVLAALLNSPSVSSGQEPAKPATLPIAVIDVTHIFKTYSPVEEKFAPLKAALKELESTIQIRSIEIETLQRKLSTPTTPASEREKMQLQLAKLQTELRIHVEKERKTLTLREQKLQAEVYKEIRVEVEKIAKERSLKMVLVRPRLSLDSANPQEVALGLNQIIMYEDGLDITDDVLKALEAKLKK